MHHSILTPHRIDAVLDALGQTESIECSAQALRYAAKCIEFSAFGGATKRSADEIGNLIQIAAQLEELANEWAKRFN